MEDGQDPTTDEAYMWKLEDVGDGNWTLSNKKHLGWMINYVDGELSGTDVASSSSWWKISSCWTNSIRAQDSILSNDGSRKDYCII